MVINNAYKRARAAIESLYDGTCDIINQQKVKDPATKQTHYEDVTIAQAQPCRLSFKNITAADQGSGASTVKQVIKLFVAPDIEIKAGSKIVATQNGRTQTYKASGEPAMYPTHQEIILDLEVYA